MTISEYAIKKPVTTLLVFLALIILGIYCTMKIPVDMYPDLELPFMVVFTEYANVGPEEVEQSLTRPLESALSGLTGLKNMHSQSSSGMSMIIFEFNYGTNLDAATGEIRDKIDVVRRMLPSDAGSPTMMRADPSMMPIMAVTLRGSRTAEELRNYAENIVQPRLEQLDGIASANIVGGREKAINVDIPRDRLEAYGLSITNVAQMISAQNIQSSGGTITSGDINYTIKTNGTYTSLEDLKNTVISYKGGAMNGSAVPNVKTIRLRDVADIYETYKAESTYAYLDGQPSVVLQLQKQSGKNSVRAAEAVRRSFPAIENELPSDVKLVESWNTTDIIKQGIAEVVRSVVEGAILAIAVLFVFLRSMKSTIIIGLAIPVSVIITLFVMYFLGITINLVSLAGLLVSIGMLVDNSIVVLENIYSYRQKDAKPEVAATLGSQEMILSISASTLTSVCIFLPMLMFKKDLGMIGQMFSDLAYTVIFSLLCSLIVAMVLVPVLSSHYLRIDKLRFDGKGKLNEINRWFNIVFSKLDTVYARGVKFVLHNRKKFILAIVILFFVSIALVKFIGFVFMPSSPSNVITVSFELPKGTKLSVTDEMLRSFEAMAMQDLKGVQYSSITAGGEGGMSMSTASNIGQVRFTLYEPSKRKADYDNEESAKQKLRKYMNSFPGAKMSFSSMSFGASGGSMSINIKCNDLEKLRATALQVEKLLRDKGGEVVSDVTSDQEQGSPQVEIIFDRDRMYQFGLNVHTVGSEVRAMINGTTSSRYSENGDDIDIIVRLSDKDKSQLADLDNLFVVNNSGVRIPLSSFAHYEETVSPVTILRENQARSIHVTLQPVSGLSLDVVNNKVKTLIDENIPKDDAVVIDVSGDYKEFINSVKSFGLIILMAAGLVFIVMASQFESFIDPFIVLLTIPLSFIGVVMIYLITRALLNVITVLGLLVLVGTIVNNGIVLVDYTNLLRKRGLGLEEACIEASRNRLRPILMTTLTTIISLAPMTFAPGEGSLGMQPMALTVFGGMSFGSLMTLFLMPTVYFIINNRRLKKQAKRAARLAQKGATK